MTVRKPEIWGGYGGENSVDYANPKCYLAVTPVAALSSPRGIARLADSGTMGADNSAAGSCESRAVPCEEGAPYLQHTAARTLNATVQSRVALSLR